MLTGTREQLAAVLVNGEDRLPGPCVAILGTPGDWAVAVQDTSHGDGVFLASERIKTQMRAFRTLDAAHAAAVAVQRLAYPGECRFRSVRVVLDDAA